MRKSMQMNGEKMMMMKENESQDEQRQMSKRMQKEGGKEKEKYVNYFILSTHLNNQNRSESLLMKWEIQSWV